MAIYKEDIVDIELESGSIHRSFLNHTIGSGDAEANRFGVRVFRAGEAVDLDGCSCQGFFRNSAGENIALTAEGTVENNLAFVTLPQACYNYEGQFCLAIKLIGGGVTGTMRIVDGVVDNTNTGSAIAPTEDVPTYQEILATYNEMVEAVENYEEIVAQQDEQIADIEDDVAQNVVGDLISGFEMFTGLFISAGLYDVTLGITASNAGSDCSDFIDVSDYQTITIRKAYCRGDRGIVAYKGTLDALKLIYNGENTIISFNVPDDCAYIRITSETSVVPEVYGIRKAKQEPERISDGSKYAIRSSSVGKRTEYIKPAALSDIPIHIYQENGLFTTDFDIESYKNTETNIVYTCNGGKGTKDGLTLANAADFLTVFLGTRADDDTTIYIADGVYRFGYTSGFKVKKNINLVALHPGKVVLVQTGDVLTFTLYSGYVYTTTRSNTVKVLQKIGKEVTELTKAENTAQVQDTQGTWYIDGSNVVYLHLFENKTPVYNQNIFLVVNYSQPLMQVDNSAQSVSLYMDGLVMIGGIGGTVYNVATNTYQKPCLYMNRCQLLGSYNGNALVFEGHRCFSKETVCRFASMDGFNYHKAFVVPEFIEIDCEASDNGMGNENPYQNGTTAHDGAVGVRVHGKYYRNFGSNVADVHDNTETVNLGCVAFDSAYGGNDYYNADFNAQQSGATMILINCKAFGSKYSLYGYAGTTLQYDICDFDGEISIN